MTSLVNYTFSFSFLLAFVVGFLILPNLSISDNILYSTKSLTISEKRTINSPGSIFTLGFFAMDSNSRWYLRIWYTTRDPVKNYVWVANRDNPLSNSTGVLKIEGPNLVLRNHSNNIVWSTNVSGYTRSPLLVGELFDNGNFVLRKADNKGEDGFLWQSFDFPTDTLLPQMKLGFDPRTRSNKILRRWKGANDPSSGEDTFELKCGGLPEFLTRDIYSTDFQSSLIYRTGPWDGTQFNGTIDEQNCLFTMINHSNFDRMSLTYDGFLEVNSHFESSLKWERILSVPGDECDRYQTCGPYNDCDKRKSQPCYCIKGFYPKESKALTEWDYECVRKTELNCHSDGFHKLKATKLPYSEGVSVERKMSPKECRQKCLKNCNCTAFVTTDIKKGGWGCAIWTGPLIDIRSNTVDGHDLYIKLAASDLDPVKEKSKIGKILGSIGGIIVLFLLCLTIFYFWKKKQKLARNMGHVEK